MEARLLPASEWPRLDGTQLGDVWHVLPSDAKVVVVEDNGVIVGTCTLLPAIHAEGLGVAESYQKHGAVLRLLLRTVAETVAETGRKSMICGAQTDEMAEYLTRWGGIPAPARLFAMPLAGVLRRFQRTKESE